MGVITAPEPRLDVIHEAAVPQVIARGEGRPLGVPYFFGEDPRLPSGWELVPNRKLFEERDARGHVDEELLSVSLAKGVTRQSDDPDRKDTSSEDKSDYKLVLKGDIAYNRMRMWQGALGVSRYQGIVSPAYVVLKPRIPLSPWYFFYLFKTRPYINEFNRFSYGLCDDQNSLRFEDFRLLYAPCPPAPEQERIAAFLDVALSELDPIIECLRLVGSGRSDAYNAQVLRLVLANLLPALAAGRLAENPVWASQLKAVGRAASVGAARRMAGSDTIAATDETRRAFHVLREGVVLDLTLGRVRL